MIFLFIMSSAPAVGIAVRTTFDVNSRWIIITQVFHSVSIIKNFSTVED